MATEPRSGTSDSDGAHPIDGPIPTRILTAVLDTVQRRAVPIGLVLLLIPLVISAVAVLIDGPHAVTRDHALMELRIRDIGRHPVLFGLYSRDGWSHPGPLVYLTLALPYRMFGSATGGLLIGALVVNGAALTGMTLIARRLGGTRAALVTLVVLSVAVRALGADLMRDPWVCFITVVPFGLFCFLVWAMTCGRVWALPVAIAVASWLVQTHVGYAPLTVPMLLGGSAWLVILVRTRDPSRTGPLLRATGLSVLVVAVAWALPLWDQFFGSGNLATTARWFSSADEGVHTVTEGARVVFGQFATLPDWVTGRRRIGSFNGETMLRTQTVWPTLLVPFLAAAWWSWRRRDGEVVRLAAVLGLGLVVAVVAVARTVGIMYEYRLLFIWVLASLAAVVVVWTAWNLVAARWPNAERTVMVPIALIVVAVLGAAEVAQVAGAARPGWDSNPTASVVRQLATKLERGGGQVVLTSESNVGTWFLQGLLLGLEKRGFDARVVGDSGGAYGAHRVLASGPVQARLLVLGGSELVTWRRGPGQQVVAYGGPVALARARSIGRRLDALRGRLLVALDAGEITQAEFERRFPAADAGPEPGVAVVSEDGR